MKTFAKKKIEIIIEAPALRKLVEVLERRKIHGYTIYPVQAGSGHEGRWEAAGMVGESGRMLSLMCVLDESELDTALKDIKPIIHTQIGIVLVSDVEVIRPDRF